MYTLPTVVKELRGTLQPCRTNPDEPKPAEPLGDPPAHLARDEKAVWRELIRITVPGVLTIQDRLIAETLCLLVAKMRRRESMQGAERAQLTACLSKMGLTPADRTRVSVVPYKDEADDDFRLILNA